MMKTDIPKPLLWRELASFGQQLYTLPVSFAMKVAVF
jgi:hypothetical protein